VVKQTQTKQTQIKQTQIKQNQRMYTHPHMPHPFSHLQTRLSPSGQIIHLSNVTANVPVILGSTLPVLQYKGRTYYIHKHTEKECRRVYFSSTRCWFILHENTPKSSTFILHAENGYKRSRHIIVAWYFPVEYLQFRARLFLARRRKERRLALAMALHPRLGGQSQMLEWLNEDTLSKICSCI